MSVHCAGCQSAIDRHRSCHVEVIDWPYDCDARHLYPRDHVYACRDHGVWWHQPTEWTPS